MAVFVYDGYTKRAGCFVEGHPAFLSFIVKTGVRSQKNSG